MIRDLFNKRGQHKKHIDSRTSNLYETSNLIEYRYDDIEHSKDLFDRLNDTITKVELDKMLTELYKKDWFLHDIFIITNDKPINQLSRETRINRKYITDCRREAQCYLKNQLINRI